MFFLNLKKISLILIVGVLSVFPFLNFNNSINNLVKQNYELRESTIPVGPKIFKTSYVFNQTSGDAIISADYVIGEGDNSPIANTPKYMGLTTNSVIPEKGATWTDIEPDLIPSSYSPTNWVPSILTDETNIVSTTIYHSDLYLQGLPSTFNFEDYYIVFQAHGSSGSQYTYYDVKPINYNAIEEPKVESTVVEKINETTVEMYVSVSAGVDPYGDSWILENSDISFTGYEQQGLNVKILDSNFENNLYSLNLEVSNIKTGITYQESSFTLEFNEPHFLESSIIVTVTLPEILIPSPLPEKQNFYVALVWLILFIIIIIMVSVIMIYNRQLKNKKSL